MVAYVRRAPDVGGSVARWMGARMPLSTALAAAVRRQASPRRGAATFDTVEMQAVREILELQAARSEIPDIDMLLIERCRTREGHHLFFFPFAGRLVHEGLATLTAWRLARHVPITFSLAINDYGFELLSDQPAPLDEALARGLFAIQRSRADIDRRRSTRPRWPVASSARLHGSPAWCSRGIPGAESRCGRCRHRAGCSTTSLPGTIPTIFSCPRPEDEVLERQLERSRLVATLGDIDRVARWCAHGTDRPHSPFRSWSIGSGSASRRESLAERVRRMTIALERES